MLFAFVFFFTQQVFAISYETLPSGVRSAGYRYTVTNKIDTLYGSDFTETSLKQDINIDMKLLSSLNDSAASFFNELKVNSPSVYNDFSAGSFSINPYLEVSVHSFGFGYGLDKKTTIYTKGRFYKARSSLNYTQTNDGNVKETGELSGWKDSDTNNIAGSVLSSIPNVNGVLIQSVFVNGYKYNPLGRWESSGYGDLEVGVMRNIIKETKWGFTATGGLVLPTGKTDDPNTLQDIGFGDGQMDIFTELAYGSYVSDKFFLDGIFRYDHQLPGSQDLRVINDPNIPLGGYNDKFDFKLGDKIEITSNINYMKNNWVNFYAGHELFYQSRSKYSSDNPISDQFYSSNTEVVAHTLKLGSFLSSIQLFQAKKFLLPGTVEIMLRHVVAGKNTPKVTRGEVEFRLYF